ncbi:MAG: Uma2 family endonuclease [Blastocatellia bacterium]|nr:Uma2 family endonuclease [Blastocatellia bacterium]
MTSGPTLIENEPLVLHLGSALQRMTDHEFFEVCRLNQDLRIERTSEGDLIICPPTGGQTGRRNFNLTGIFSAWVEKDGTGVGFDSSTGFTLPNGAKRSPDVAWIKRSRWESLTEEEKEEFPPLCPDFVVELRSRTDPLDPLQAKMEEYIENGASLGWLIDPKEKKVYIYRPQSEAVCLDDPATISGDPLLSGFTLDLKRLWP